MIYLSPEEVAAAIKGMLAWDAPAIGEAAGFAVALATKSSSSGSLADPKEKLAAAYVVLRDSRPIAVNLFWALDRVWSLWEPFLGSPEELVAELLKEEAVLIAE